MDIVVRADRCAVDAPARTRTRGFAILTPGLRGYWWPRPLACVRRKSFRVHLVNFAVGSLLSHPSVVGRLHCFDTRGPATGHLSFLIRSDATTRVLRGKKVRRPMPDPVRSRPLPTFLPVSYSIILKTFSGSVALRFVSCFYAVFLRLIGDICSSILGLVLGVPCIIVKNWLDFDQMNSFYRVSMQRRIVASHFRLLARTRSHLHFSNPPFRPFDFSQAASCALPYRHYHPVFKMGSSRL